MRHLLFSLALLFGALGPVSAAVAQAPPSLTGETFNYSFASYLNESIAAVCDREGTSTITYTIPDPAFEGLTFAVATGPYPGTFTETGTVTVGPQTMPDIPPEIGGFDPGTRGFTVGPLISLEASFTIDSPVGQVEGTKTLVIDPGNSGSCAAYDMRPFGTGFVRGVFRDVRATLSYDATITTATGSFRDTGTSDLFLQEFDGEVVPVNGSGFSYGEFVESFASNGVVALCPPDDDDSQGDDQGDDDDCQGDDEDPGQGGD